MLIILSPAKTLDFDSPVNVQEFTQPDFLDESQLLVEQLRELSPPELGRLMGISEALAVLNAGRYSAWSLPFSPENARQALFAFNGDVYEGLQAASLSPEDVRFAQGRLRILSGLYGVLRPLDLIQPHRLEMGTRLATERGRSLYDWWGDQVTDLLRRDLDESPGADVLVNLASAEYFSVVRPERLGARVISPRFEDRDQHGEPRVVSFYAKRARGIMAAWLIRGRVRTPGRLVDFDGDGYAYDEDRSTKDQPVFVR